MAQSAAQLLLRTSQAAGSRIDAEIDADNWMNITTPMYRCVAPLLRRHTHVSHRPHRLVTRSAARGNCDAVTFHERRGLKELSR